MELLTALLVLILIFIIFLKSSINTDKTWFMSKEYTNGIRGIMCIIIVLVHIPDRFSNNIQETIGSLGFVCVTLFFLFSSFGLMYSLKNKKDYMKNFIRNRFFIIYVPFIIINIIDVIIRKKFDSNTLLVIFGIQTSFVSVLILFYIIFYIINIAFKKEQIRDILFIMYPIIFCIFDMIFNWGLWGAEAVGFSLGFLIYYYFDKIKYILKNKNKLIFIIFPIFICIFGLLYCKYKNVYIIGNYFIKILLYIFMISFMFEFTSIVKINNKILSFLGNISYEVFLIHGIVITILSRFTNMSSGVYIWLVIMITLGLATIYNKFNKFIAKKIKKI